MGMRFSSMLGAGAAMAAPAALQLANTGGHQDWNGRVQRDKPPKKAHTKKQQRASAKKKAQRKARRR